jgi:hypothetical protein
MLPNEPSLCFRPVPIIMDSDEKLSKESRALYARLENVEHEAPVRFMGTVDPKSFWIVEEAVNSCWERHTTKRSDHHRSERKTPKK